MANPDFVDESVADQGGAGPFTVLFPAAWAANQIALIFVATDGWIPTLTTANGFAIATDVNGNAASVTTNAGVAGASECGMFVFWKRLVGSTSGTDPAPVIGAAPGGSTMAIELNTYSGCRTTGNPFHIIATGTAASSTNITSPSVTPTLNACTLVTAAASANDDQAFNSWTFTGSASPAGTLDSGWHDATGNACAFVGGRGGYATTGGARTGACSFAAASKQALVTIVLASLNEAFAGDDDAAARPRLLAGVTALGRGSADDDLPVQASGAPDDVGALQGLPVQGVPLAARIASDDEISTAAAASVADDDVVAWPALPMAPLLPVAPLSSDDETSTPPSVIDDDVPSPLAVRGISLPPAPPLSPDDEFPGGSLPPGVDEESRAWSGIVAPRAPFAVPAQADELVAAVTSGIGGASDAQRSFLAPPQTGTLSTTAPLPAWTTSHAYVIDPTQGGINRVQNGGNHYQCSQDGTSASSGGGPSGTGTTITDGTTVWRYIGPAQTTNTAAGSQILCTVMRGNESQAATVAPTDNDGGGTYTLITDNEYVNFTGSFAGVWRRPTASNAKTNFQTSGVWGGSGGAGDEMSIGWIEIQGVSVGAPHAFSHVERLASSGGTVTAGAITTTVPCVIISYWFGNGTVQTAGQPDAATPAGGLTLIAGSTGMLSLTTNGYVQHMVAWRKAAAGTNFAEVWTASPTDEGAQLVTVAFPDLSAPASIAADDDMPGQRLRPAIVSVLRSVVASDDELSPSADADADDGMTRPTMLWVVPVLTAVGQADDEVAGQAVVEDDGTLAMGLPVIAVRAPGIATDIDELPTTPLEEWGQVMAVPVVVAPRLVSVPADDDLVALAPSIEDNELTSAVPTAIPLLLMTVPSDDELASAGGASMVEEDATVTSVPTVMQPQLVTPPSVDEIASASGASVLDDEQPATGVVWLGRPVAAWTGADDEVATALAVDEDQGAVMGVAAQAPVLSALAVDDDLVQAPLDDDAPVWRAPLAPLPAALWVAADDDLPLAALLDDAGQLFALMWSAPLVAQPVPGDDEVPTDVAPVVIVDDDQLLAQIVWRVPALLSGPVVADELPRPKKPKPVAAGTSLLDGFIAKQVASALGAAKMLKPATLIKITPGVRTPGLVSGGTNPTRASYAAKGIEQNLLSLQLAGTLLEGVNAAIRLFGATIAGGQVPVAGDEIVMAGVTYTIVAGGVSRDSAAASYLCQCQK